MSVPKIVVEITNATYQGVQDTIVQGICRKNSQQRVRVKVLPKFCLCMFSFTLPWSNNLA